MELEGLSRDEARSKLLGHDVENFITLPKSLQTVVELVQETRGQWRVLSSMAGATPIAIDRVALDVAAKWLGITPSRQLLAEFGVVEAEALRLMRQENND